MEAMQGRQGIEWMLRKEEMLATMWMRMFWR